mgnify:CR=1 FL=1|jgi:hypothetical protein
MKALIVTAVVLLGLLALIALQGLVIAVIGDVAWSRHPDHHLSPGFVVGHLAMPALLLAAALTGIVLLLKRMKRL